MELNHGVLVYPGHMNASVMVDTPESFDTVPLHSEELRQAINKIELDGAEKKMTRDIGYLAKQMDCKIPPLPFSLKDEFRLYPKLINDGDFDRGDGIPEGLDDETRLCYAILKHVNGKTIWPKLPCHFRKQAKRYTKNKRIKEATKRMKPSHDKLLDINKETLESLDTTSGADENAEDVMSTCSDHVHHMDTTEPRFLEESGRDSSNVSTDIGDTQQPVQPRASSDPLRLGQLLPPSRGTGWASTHASFNVPSYPRPFPGIPGGMQLVVEDRFVGHVQVNGRLNLGMDHPPENITRGPDKKKRKPRSCKSCGRQDCPGRLGGRSAKSGTNSCKNS
jgi:hypothetical protein